MLNVGQIEQFHTQGFLVLPRLAEPAFCEQVMAFAQAQLQAPVQPVEYEADTGYPGAPVSKQHAGGDTVRRLLQAYARAPLFSQWAVGEPLRALLLQLLGEGALLSQAHHNCIMTKQAKYSSTTGWHRDIRYWSFTRPELISVWLALRDEIIENGCLWVIPGSHRMELEADRFDSRKFLRQDHPGNFDMLQQARAVPLSQGDVLLFHSNLFHAAGRNETPDTKYSMVFTYRAADNLPLPGSRSASLPEIAL